MGNQPQRATIAFYSGENLVELKGQSSNSLFNELAVWNVALSGSAEEITLSDNTEGGLVTELRVRFSGFALNRWTPRIGR